MPTSSKQVAHLKLIYKMGYGQLLRWVAPLKHDYRVCKNVETGYAKTVISYLHKRVVSLITAFCTKSDTICIFT